MAARLRVQADPERLEVRPGSPASVEIRVFNATEIVDQFTVEVLGIDPRWVTADPPSLSLLPGKEGALRLSIHIPQASAMPAGRHTVGVKVASATDPGISRVEELQLQVAPVPQGSLEPVPQMVRGRRGARFGVVVRNQGNVPLSVGLAGSDPETAVRFRFDPQRFQVPVGGQVRARARASARAPLTGTPTQRVLHITGDGAPVPLETKVTFVQRPLLSGALLRLVGMVALLAVVLGAWLFKDQISQALGLPGPQGAVAIATFAPEGPLDERGCATLRWSVRNAEVITLTAPDGGSVEVPAEGSRELCGRAGEEAVLEARGQQGRDEKRYAFSPDLAVTGGVETGARGTTAVFDFTTNQEADVVVEAGGQEETSRGITHHVEIGDFESGELVPWTLRVRAQGQADLVLQGEVRMQWVYGRISLAAEPEVVSGLGGTIDSDAVFVVVPWPEPAVLGRRSCPGHYNAPVMEEVFFPLAPDGGTEGPDGQPLIRVDVAICQGQGDPDAPPPQPDPDRGAPVPLEPGEDPEWTKQTITIRRGSISIEVPLVVERIVSDQPPP